MPVDRQEWLLERIVQNPRLRDRFMKPASRTGIDRQEVERYMGGFPLRPSFDGRRGAKLGEWSPTCGETMSSNAGNIGSPVLAYTKETASSVDALLLFKSSTSRSQAILCLSVAVQDSDEALPIVFQYDPDKVVSGTIQPATTNLPQSRLVRIARSHAPLHTLSLTLRSRCPIWGSSSGFIDDHAGKTRQLASIAKATELYILFDLEVLNKKLIAFIRHFVSHSDYLTGFPVARYYEESGFVLLDVSIFDTVPARDEDTVEHEDAVKDEETEDEEPPPYQAKSLKRPRVGELPQLNEVMTPINLHLSILISDYKTSFPCFLT
jgi:hypothetical protein